MNTHSTKLHPCAQSTYLLRLVNTFFPAHQWQCMALRVTNYRIAPFTMGAQAISMPMQSPTGFQRGACPIPPPAPPPVWHTSLRGSRSGAPMVPPAPPLEALWAVRNCRFAMQPKQGGGEAPCFFNGVNSSLSLPPMLPECACMVASGVLLLDGKRQTMGQGSTGAGSGGAISGQSSQGLLKRSPALGSSWGRPMSTYSPPTMPPPQRASALPNGYLTLARSCSKNSLVLFVRIILDVH